MVDRADEFKGGVVSQAVTQWVLNKMPEDELYISVKACSHEEVKCDLAKFKEIVAGKDDTEAEAIFNKIDD